MNGTPFSLVAVAIFLGAVGIVAFAIINPALVNATYLGGLVLLQILLACLCHYKRAFFPLLICTFLAAGIYLPFRGEARQVRWLVLGLGAGIGLIIWMKGKDRHLFGYFHLTALICVIAALMSTLVSGVPRVAMLKVLSLFLLFLYASTGARAALRGREAGFVRYLVLGCEILTYVSAVSYLVFRFPLYGNPNSIGAVMGIVVFPVLFWNVLINEDKTERFRRILCLLLSGYLLYDSLSRASFVAAAFATVAVCFALRRQLFLLRATLVFIFLLAFVGVVDPPKFEAFVATTTSDLLFKGKAPTSDVWKSREGPWTATVSSIQRHPWFGSGFGTSDMMQEIEDAPQTYTKSGTNREHGNSYLAIAEYMGLIGIIPFGVLIFLVMKKLVHFHFWLRSSGHGRHYGGALAVVVTAGLVHAFFEDWLFAVGFYICVFFWSLTFVFMDIALPSGSPFPLRFALFKNHAIPVGLRTSGGRDI